MYKILYLALAWFSFFEGAILPPPDIHIQQTSTVDEGGCALPPPSNVHWTIAGTTYLFFAWDAVPEAAYYRVKVFKYPNDKMIYSRRITAQPSNNGVVVDDLLPGASYYIEVRSVCANGVESAKAN